MWYCVCEGDPEHNRIAYSVKMCTSSRILAYVKMWKLKKEDPKWDYWVDKRKEHADPDYKQYRCPDCGNLMSKRELDHTWDWAGPHCNACGCTGVSMFTSVISEPIMSGYQGIRAKFASILGWETMEKIDREEKRKRKEW